MDRELELLLLALDAWLQAGPDEMERHQAIFDKLLADILMDRPHLKKETLLRALRAYYPRWLHSQQHPPTLPPKA